MRLSLTFRILAIFFTTNCVVHAQEEGTSNLDAIKETNSENIVFITPEDCLLLTRHRPRADVEYKPGVDAQGRKVVPADVGGGNALGLGDNGYSFYMTHDALKGFGRAGQFGPAGSQEGKIILGQVTVKDGDVLWNGTSLKELEKNRLYLLCDEQRREKRRPIVKR